MPRVLFAIFLLVLLFRLEYLQSFHVVFSNIISFLLFMVLDSATASIFFYLRTL